MQGQNQREGCAEMAFKYKYVIGTVIGVALVGIAGYALLRESSDSPVMQAVACDKFDYALYRELTYPKQVTMSAAELNDAAVQVKAIELCCRTEDVSELDESFKRFVPTAIKLPWNCFGGIYAPLYNFLRDDFFAQGENSLILEADALQRYLEINICLALHTGDLLIERRNRQDYLLYLDGKVYAALKGLSVAYNEIGRGDLKAVVDDHLKKWIDHMEGADCFIRSYIKQYLMANSRLVAEGKLDESHFRNEAKILMRGLTSFGYTPLWVKNFDEGDGKNYMRQFMKMHGVGSDGQ